MILMKMNTSYSSRVLSWKEANYGIDGDGFVIGFSLNLTSFY